MNEQNWKRYEIYTGNEKIGFFYLVSGIICYRLGFCFNYIIYSCNIIDYLFTDRI